METDEQRLVDIIEMIGKIAARDFNFRLEISEKEDMIDAISLGLNMLSEEMEFNMVEKKRLDEVNLRLENFAMGTAHDLKSPINSITGLIELLKNAVIDKNLSDINLLADKLNEVNGNMKNLVEEILNNSRVPASEVDTTFFPLDELIKEIIRIEELAKKAEFVINGSFPKIIFNRCGLYRVIKNLLENAIKYCDKEVCKIEISVSEMEDHYIMKVCDNGPGIHQKFHSSIFEIFHRGNQSENKESQGIGLASVKAILEGSGEKIWLESEKGKGASFFFTLKKSY